MGNTNDKPAAPMRTLPTQKQQNLVPNLPSLENDTIAKSEFFEAIKKRDIILFKKTLQHFNVRPTDIVGPPEQRKTVLHKLAESNFSEGMALILQLLSSLKPETISKIVNMKDSDGNTPLLLCCLSNSVETLEVLAKDSHIDMEAKNAAKKTALEIAIEMESPCVNVLTSTAPGSMTSTKATIKSSGADSPYQVNSLEEASNKGSRGDGDFDSQPGSQGSISSVNSKKGHTQPNVKELKELRDTLKPDIHLRLPEILADLDARETNFVDSEFPHETYYLESEENEGQLKKQYPELQWKRPLGFLGPHAKSVTVYNTFTLGDVSTSPLIGCEVYSALAIMAEFPQRLSRIFITKDLNKPGVYALKFTIAGIQIEMLLDDYFPCADSSTLLYSKPGGRELWFPLLEKAFAKLYGGYSEVEKVGVVEALEALTGMPIAQTALLNADVDRLWRKLVDYDKKNYLLCVGDNKNGQNSKTNRVFNIVSLVEVNEHRLLKIRNHFGQFNWKGDFSASSPLWTKDLKEKVGFTPNDKSSFYISIKDMIKEFDFLVVCHYHDNWSKTQLNATSEPKHFSYFEINVEREIDAYISVHQKHPEFVDEAPGYNISPVEMVLARDADGNFMEGIAFGEQTAFLGKATVFAQEGLESKLKPGRYILAVKVKWVDGGRHDFFLNVLSSAAVKLSQLEPVEVPGFLEKVYLSSGSISKEKFDMTNGCEFASGWVGSHLWICAFNRGTKTWNLEINFDRMKNIKIAKKFRTAKQDSIKIVLKPNQKAVTYLRRINSDPVAIAWSFNQSWE